MLALRERRDVYILVRYLDRPTNEKVRKKMDNDTQATPIRHCGPALRVWRLNDSLACSLTNVEWQA